ncbi:MAG TPA: hypothetical protein DFS52_17095 [Myxococcales bacterium]|jgi:hypothetical protein|nr:hypothetical protein [Myxococcales bacterium]
MNGPLVAVLLAATTAAPERLAIYPLTSHGAPPEVMQQLGAALRIELARAGVAQVVTEEEGRSALKQPCGLNKACLSRFGRAAGATEVLFGEVHAHPDSFAVTLRLLDVTSGSETRSATASINRDVEEMVWATRAQVCQLKAPERYAGRIRFEVPSGAQLFVDGHERTERGAALRPGSYAVRIVDSGREIETWVEVKFEQTATVRLRRGESAPETRYEPWSDEDSVELRRLAPELRDSMSVGAELVEKDESTAPRWPAYTALGVGIVLIAAGVALQVRANSLRNEIETMRGPSGNVLLGKGSEVRSLQTSMSTARVTGWSLLGAGLAAGLGGGAYLLLVPAPTGARAEIGMTTSF